MMQWPPYRMDRPDEPAVLDVHGLAAGPYTAQAAVEAELALLELLRDDHRRARWVITASWIVSGGFALLAPWAWWTLIPAAGFALLAAQHMATTDWRAGRGRELDRDIANAQGRMRGLLGKEGR